MRPCLRIPQNEKHFPPFTPLFLWNPSGKRRIPTIYIISKNASNHKPKGCGGFKIDNLDKRIIEIMKKDSRCPFVEIANQLGVSEGTVRSRVHRMTEEGIIRGFTIKTSSRNVKALVEIRIDVNTDTEEIAKELAGYDGVTEVFEVTGDQDIIAIVDVESSQHLNDIIERVRRYDNILSTRTRLILKEHFGEA